MRPIPIARYPDQNGGGEPVAWPPARVESPLFKPKLAAPMFRRATLVEVVEARGRDRSDGQPAPGEEADTRRRDSIFSRLRDVGSAPPPPPPPAPKPDYESRLAEAYDRGVREGRDSANAEAAKARDLERAELRKQAVVERLDFQMNEYARLAETISSGLVEVEHRIADVVARVLQPFVNKAISREIIDELVENITRLRAGGQSALMRIRGPEPVLQALQKKLAGIAVDVEYAPEDSVEVTVEAQRTTIRSAFAPWAELIASLDEKV